MSFHLEVVPEGDCALCFRRKFEAPRAVLWRAFTDPGLIAQWLWTEDHRMTGCEQDFRVGGSFRWCWAVTGGGSMGVSGSYSEILPEEKIIHTEIFDDDWTGGETTVTTAFRDDDGGTMMEMTVVYPSPEARERVLGTPMAAGMEEGYARLDNLLPGWA
jgi:uncharacterized protein YndB with AHSA1/START domain